ncbi:outer membrane protein assembly factor BamA [Thermodesulfobacteriota bacterium]
MSRFLSLVLIAIIALLPNTIHSQETVQVIILPFEVHAMEDLSYLKSEIPGLIKKQLKAEGAVLLDVDIPPDASWKAVAENTDDIRRLGAKNGADYVVWGSLTWIGQKYSLDAKAIESFGEAPPDIFFEEGESIENLIGSVKKLSGTIGLKLFKRERVAEVVVSGNKRIEADAIKRVVKTKPGDVYLAKNLSEDLKTVYAMGYFDDIRVEAEAGPDGRIVIFKVTEKPTIRFIHTKGNTVYDDEEIKENIDIRTGSILNVFKLNNNVKRIEDLYRSKNYHNVKVTYNLEELKTDQVDLNFVIEEGEKIRIEKIIFQGNVTFDSKTLKKQMKTSEKGFFSWVTSSGELNRADLEQDVARLAAFYHNNGYIQARIGDPQVVFSENMIDITLKIDEGPQFKVGKVDIAGDLILPKEVLLEKVNITKETYYNREILRKDVLLLAGFYSDEGYAYAEVSPRIDQDVDNLTVNINYTIEKGKPVYFEKIIISGNTKTRDKVIRRELQVYEQELYSGRRLKNGIRNLYRMDFFEDVKADTVKGSTDDTMVLKVDVTEKPTGQFSFGGGYSTYENLFGTATISQKNLFGRAQVLELKATVGSRSQRFIIGFTEPWLFDIPLSAGFDLFNWETDYISYDKDSVGGALRFSYPVYRFTRAYLTFAYEDADIQNIDPNASLSIKQLEGKNITTSVTPAIRWDSRDEAFNPSKGSVNNARITYAGFGGDVAFTKIVGETGWYFPIVWKTTGFLHGRIGWGEEGSGGIWPDYERFYLGGINTVRGFEWREISAFDINGDIVGGTQMFQFNAEYRIPLFGDIGLVGLVFYDAGNVWGDNDSMDLGSLRDSVGFGFRWRSPMGPIRVEYGYILDPKEGEPTNGRWEFTMGTAF